MPNTVTLSQLITRLAAVTDSDTNTTRLFLRAFFATIEESVLSGEPVTINGIGTFSRKEGLPGHPVTVAFIPDQTLADNVNAPFAMFEPVELADNVNFEPEGEQGSCKQATTAMTSLQPEPAPLKWPEEEEEEEETLPEVAPATTPETNSPEVEALSPESGSLDPRTEQIQQPSQPLQPAPEPEKEKNLNWVYIAALIVVIGGILGYFGAVWATADLFPSDDEDVVEEVAAEAEPATPVFEEIGVDQVSQPTQAAEHQKEEVKVPVEESKPAVAAAPKTDTVTKTRFLATMAREYYGKSIYWVFIYEANKDRIANPNQIRPGLEVVIPDKSSFAESTEAETLRKAERLQAQIQK